MEKKNVLIVYAHQEPKSFNGAIKDAAVDALKRHGHDVTVSDLYAMEFDPVTSKKSFKGELKNPDFFCYEDEAKHAVANNTEPEDIQEERKKIHQADLVILVFPMYNLGVPAILKGWMDRCFLGPIFTESGEVIWFDKGPYRHKKFVVAMTTGGSMSFYNDRGIFGDLGVLLWPIHNTLRMQGANVLPPQMFFAPKVITGEQRTTCLQDWVKRLDAIFDEKPLDFINIDHFDQKSFSLLDKHAETYKNDNTGPTVGQHFGKPFKPLPISYTSQEPIDT